MRGPITNGWHTAHFGCVVWSPQSNRRHKRDGGCSLHSRYLGTAMWQRYRFALHAASAWLCVQAPSPLFVVESLGSWKRDLRSRGVMELIEPPAAFRWCVLRAPRTNGAVAPHPGTFPGRSQGREALSAPGDPSTRHQRPRPWECGTQLVRRRHLCLQAVKERGSPPVVPGAHPSPCVRSRGMGGQRVSVTAMPWPTTPRWAQRHAPMASPPGLEH